ncbi:hypothetical protein MMC30_008171 [Trapelia coarctata]|nr:hypothetical protein [Trapelia coarctata]
MVQYGYTSGARSKPSFSYARNVLAAEKRDDCWLSLHMHKLHSKHTLIWNIARKKLPSGTIADLEAEMANGPVADWNMKGKQVDPPVSLHINGQGHELGCHNEYSPPNASWVVSYMSNRTRDDNLGGAFFFAKHKVYVRTDTDNLFVHNSQDWHDITPQDIDWKT